MITRMNLMKCLLILGVRHTHGLQLQRPFVHTDLEVLELLPVEASNGGVVCKQYEAVAQRTGLPKMILSDHGSDDTAHV
ncbi:MAG: hypothetical protein HYV60_06760 [Planctomycetia bacterium]|nr:hypothetical protein [Planctomycetia bacterium]